ncbi:MAG: SpoIIE family protein phosphatase, partial [Ilumatobacter sp.]
EVASELAVERIRDVLVAEENAPTAERVVDAISDANGDIFRAAIATPGQAGMGTTVTVIAVIEDPMAGRGAPNIDDNDGVRPEHITPVVPREAPEALVLANVGDSRTYLFRHERLRRVTIDHSYVQELVSSGHITDDEARTHPRRNIITRALGIEPDVNVDWWTLPLVRGDRFLLCSDGLVDEVDDDRISEVLKTVEDPQEATDQLVTLANEAGGRDNITIIVLDVLDGDDPPDPTQEIDLTPVWANDDLELTDDEIARIEAGLPRTPATDELVAPAARKDGRKFGRRKGDKADESDDTTTKTPDDGAGSTTLAALTGSAVANNGDAPDPTDTAVADEALTGRAARKAAKQARRAAGDGPRLGRVVAVFVVLALFVAGFVALAAWARRGYYVDFNDQNQVVVFQGRPGGLLWFEPTAETTGDVTRDELTDSSAQRVDDRPTFDSESAAILFVRDLDIADPGTDSSSDEDPGEDAATAEVSEPGDSAPRREPPTTTTP